MFSMSNYKRLSNVVGVVPIDNNPRVIDGVDIIEALMPVSEFTGRREDPIECMQRVINDLAKAALLNQILVELPTSESVKMSDDDLLDYVTPRLSTGTKSENDDYRKVLANVVDSMRRVAESSSSSSDTSMIEFNASDTASVDNEVSK